MTQMRPLDPSIRLRPATPADIPLLEAWDREPHVMAATGDDARDDDENNDYWHDEFARTAPDYRYYLGEVAGRPVGAMLIIDPHTEATGYWGAIEPGLRALDVWIGPPGDLGRGFGEMMMRRAFQICFAEPAVTAIVIDPLAVNVRAQRFYQRLGFRPEGRRVFGTDDCLVHRLTRTDWRHMFPAD
jgi:aminoglycoside 6'-N-acetyltransferase